MRILIVHNYHQFRGGDDEATEQEVQLLRQQGHSVELYFRHNDDIKNFSPPRKALLFFEPTVSIKSYRELTAAIQRFQPDIVHVQGFFPLVSPAIYYACAACHIPVVQTLHDYRILCAASTFFREGQICELCLNTSPLPSVQHGCYRNSRLQTASVALMLGLHHGLGTWEHKVAAFLTPSEFARQKFIQGGMTAGKIFVRPNFLTTDPGAGTPGAGTPRAGTPRAGTTVRHGAVYIGRLSAEKGLEVLLEAWRSLPHVPLTLIGDGPFRGWVEDYITTHSLDQVNLMGWLSLDQVLASLQRSAFLVMPSVWYETFGRTILEAYATATPVIGSNLGAIAELVQPDITGRLFPPGNAAALADTVQAALDHPAQLEQWGRAARQVYEERFQAHRAYDQLMDVYEAVLGSPRSPTP